MRIMRLGLCAVLLAARASADPQTAAKLLVSGDLPRAERELTDAVRRSPSDWDARFGLGVAQFLGSVERLGRSLHRYGLDPSPSAGALSLIGLPVGRLPVPPNPSPEVVSYDKFREIVQTWVNDLARVDATLAKIEGDAALELAFGLVRLDLSGDGRGDDEEALWRIFSRLSGEQLDEAEVAAFVIRFDRADAEWLRGYCNLLSGISEFFLAYDQRKQFETAAHLFFKRVESPHPFLKDREDWTDFLDMIAWVHLTDWPLKEPARMKKAHAHFLSVVQHSRQTWKLILAETDDDREWIPGPKQTSQLPGGDFTPDMLDAWHAFLDELESLLNGEKRVPFWRPYDGGGLNLRRFFHEPRDFSLVLSVQGSALTPFLEKGALTEPDFWRRLNERFDGRFFMFAIWVN